MGRVPLDRLPRRGGGGDRQPERTADDPLLPRGRGGDQGEPAAAGRGRRRDRGPRPRTGPARVRDAPATDPSRRQPRPGAGRGHPGPSRRVRSARARRRRPHGPTVRRAAYGSRDGARRRDVADPRHAGHDRRGGRAAVVRRVRGGGARRGGGEAARGYLPAGPARDVQDQARAHRRLRRGRVSAPQERPRCRRVAPARPLRRLGCARQRRRDRRVPDGPPTQPPRGAAALGHELRRAPLGLGAGDGRGPDAAKRRGQPLEPQEGPLVRPAPTRTRRRGPVRPHGGEPVPPHGAVRPVAPRPRSARARSSSWRSRSATTSPRSSAPAARDKAQPARAALRLASARRSASRRSRSTSLVSRYVMVEAIARWPAVASISSCICCAIRR